MLFGVKAEILSTQLDGQKQSDPTLHDVIVIYDRNYAIRKMGTDMKNVVGDISLEDWQTFTREVWENVNSTL